MPNKVKKIVCFYEADGLEPPERACGVLGMWRASLGQSGDCICLALPSFCPYPKAFKGEIFLLKLKNL